MLLAILVEPEVSVVHKSIARPRSVGEFLLYFDATPETPILRRRANKGKEKDRGCYEPRP